MLLHTHTHTHTLYIYIYIYTHIYIYIYIYSDGALWQAIYRSPLGHTASDWLLIYTIYAMANVYACIGIFTIILHVTESKYHI